MTENAKNSCPKSCPDMEYARAYIRLQEYENLYNKKEALERGTIFKDLYRPYYEKVDFKFAKEEKRWTNQLY